MNSDIIMQIFVMHKHVQPQDAHYHKVEGPNKFLSYLKTCFHEMFFQFTLEDVNRLRYNIQCLLSGK